MMRSDAWQGGSFLGVRTGLSVRRRPTAPPSDDALISADVGFISSSFHFFVGFIPSSTS